MQLNSCIFNFLRAGAKIEALKGTYMYVPTCVFVFAPSMPILSGVRLSQLRSSVFLGFHVLSVNKVLLTFYLVIYCLQRGKELTWAKLW